MTSLLTAALEWHAAGTSIVPTRVGGGKSPHVAWKPYQITAAHPAQLERWFANGTHDGLGVITGAVSGNLEMLEVEARAVHLATEIGTALTDHGLTDLWHRIDNGCVEVTPTGGIHWHYRVEGPAKPNTKLASRPNTAGGVDVMIETRGEGGFTVLAPSNGRTHPSGRPWTRMGGSPANIPTITVDERDALHNIIRARFDETPLAPVYEPARPTPSSSDGLRPGDDYGQKTDWADLLEPEGWRRVGRPHSGNQSWVRPGKDPRDGTSATTRQTDTGDWLYVFTTSTAFEAERAYSKFAAYTLLHHGGDHTEAARQLRRDGYGDDRPFPTPPPPAVNIETTLGIQDPADDPEHRSWQPVNLTSILDGSWEPQTPTVGRRNDGVGMFYLGKRHTVSSESEAGKTWFMLSAAQNEIDAGNHVVYLDFEDDAGPVVGRLMTLGVEADRIREYFHYIRPEEKLGAGYGYEDVDTVLNRYYPTLAIVDGVTEAMTLHNLDPLSNVDAATFGRLLPKRLSDAGAATVSLDHVPKANDNRGRYSIGAVHKLNGLDGAAYVLDARRPFGVGMVGKSTVRIAKDRPGQLRKHALPSSGGLHWFADLVLNSTSAKVANIEVTAPIEEADDFRPTMYMQRVSDALQKYGPLSQRRIDAAVKGKAETIRNAVSCLILDGYVSEKSPHELLKPYLDMSGSL